jgi:hypothetical protein
MALSDTAIVNQALGCIGAKSIASLDTEQTITAQKARDVYAQTRDALLRSINWSFAKVQASLTAATAPTIGDWAYAYVLPDDFLRMTTAYGDDKYEVVGAQFLSNSAEANIEYIARVTDTTLQESIAQKLERSMRKAGVVNDQTRQGGPTGLTWLGARRVNFGRTR